MFNNRYTTLAEAEKKLKERGYTANFSVNEHGKLVNEKKEEFDSSQVTLDEYHRFEGISNPADSTIIYAVQTRSGKKGTVIDSYGADGSEITSEFMNKAEQRQHDE